MSNEQKKLISRYSIFVKNVPFALWANELIEAASLKA